MILQAILYICSMFSLSVLLKEMDGPFNLITRTRLWLFRQKYVGVFFFDLFKCYYCVGTYSGVFVYLLHQRFHHIEIIGMILWGLTGAIVSLMGDVILGVLARSNNNDQK